MRKRPLHCDYCDKELPKGEGISVDDGEVVFGFCNAECALKFARRLYAGDHQ